MSGSMSPSRRSSLIQFGRSPIPLNLHPLIDYLHYHRILPDSKIEELRRLGESGRMSLMKMLTRQGNEAFDHLFRSLVHSQQAHLATALRALVSPDVLSSLENDGPAMSRMTSNFGDFDKERDDVEMTEDRPQSSKYEGRIPVNMDFYRMHKEEVYPNFSQPRGFALIISNKKFHGEMPQRTGTEQDVEVLHDLFESLGYVVEVYYDLTGKQLRTVLSNYCTHPRNGSVSSAIVAFLSHGEHEIVYGVDQDEVSIHELLSFLNGHNAPLLANKPKIVLIQACRGARKDKGTDQVDGPSTKEFLNCLAPQPNTRSKTAAEADILVAYATPPHYVSWRNSMKGSWFIQAFTRVVKEHARYWDLLSMLTAVNRVVVTEYSAQDEKYKQIPEHHSRLTKKFYFFPLSQ